MTVTMFLRLSVMWAIGLVVMIGTITTIRVRARRTRALGRMITLGADQ